MRRVVLAGVLALIPAASLAQDGQRVFSSGYRFVEMSGAGFDEFGGNAIDVQGVDTLDQCTGKAVFHSE